MSKKVERAKELRSGTCGNYNCAQAVLIPTAEEKGLTQEDAAKLAKYFGTGMKIGSTCGAVTGGLMVLGLSDASEETVAEYLKTLQERHGGCLDCPALLKRNQEQVRLDKKVHCDGMICECMGLAGELLAK